MTAAPPTGRLAGLWADEHVRLVLGIVALAVLYRGVAEVGYSLQFAGPVAGIVWLPVGVGVAFLYLCGLRFWPGVLIGDLLANDYGALPLGVGARPDRREPARGRRDHAAPAGVRAASATRWRRSAASVCMLVAIVAGTTVSATIGSLSLWLGDVIDEREIPPRLADLVARRRHRRARRPPARARLGAIRRRAAGGARRGVEAALMLLALVGAERARAAHRASRSTYLVFPPLIWAALRLGRHGATVAIAVAAGFAIWETHAAGRPVRVRGPHVQRAQHAAVHRRRGDLDAVPRRGRGRARARAERLAASRTRIVEAADNERRRIEQNLHDGAQQRLTGARRAARHLRRARARPTRASPPACSTTPPRR